MAYASLGVAIALLIEAGCSKLIVAQYLSYEYDICFRSIIEFMASHFLKVEFQVACHRAIQGFKLSVMNLLIVISSVLIIIVSFAGFTAMLSMNPPLGMLIILAFPGHLFLIGFPVYAFLVTSNVCFLFLMIILDL